MQTIPALFLERVNQTPDVIAAWAQTPDPEDQFFLDEAPLEVDGPDGWTPATYGQMHRQVAGLAKRLESLGVARGVPVAILANTSERWAVIDLAIQCLGGITVGIYPTLLPEQVRYQLEHSEAALLIVEGEAQFTRCLPFIDGLTDLQHVASLTPSTSVPQLTPARPDLEWLSAQIERVRAEDVATYIYTSGTTGHPKAVVLNHHNFTSIIEATRTRIPLHSGERSVVFLPLAHVLQRFSQYRGLRDEAVGWFCPSIADLPDTIRVSRPHVMATVPRMLEKIRAKVESQAAARSPTALSILGWAIGVGRTVNEKRWNGDHLGFRLVAQQHLADRLVFSKIRAGLGGHLRLLISGGAALDPELATWFEAIGIAVREGWGLSETTAPATANGIDDFRFGTVGKALEGTEVALADDGEILVRGPGVFQGYLKDEEATSMAFTEEGYFRTGDLGVIEDGFVRIVGRKKEILVTAGGKNVAPVPIEHILQGGFIGSAVVVGDDRPYLVALLAPETERLEAHARERGWAGELADWTRRPEFLAQVEVQVVAANAKLPPFETVKRWHMLSEPLTEENNMLTPTLKLKRRFINERYQQEIDALYSQPAQLP
jgi:long-chain acyl-CoA synthetase